MLSGSESTSVLAKVDKAVEIVRHSKGAVVALSAGVDSSLVAFIACKALGKRAAAITAVSESLPLGELENAQRVALEIGIKHLAVRTRETADPDYVANSVSRCYYCKETLYREVRYVADSLGLEAILDGTQLDDLDDDRPGLQAARQAGVISPLAIVGFRKSEVREAARLLGLSVWDKPAMPCLSSRIPHGEVVTVQKLSMVDQAERFIKAQTGVRELRVRYHGGSARIEVGPEERRLFFNEALMELISTKLTSLGFSSVALDLCGYRSKTESPTASGGMLLPLASP